MLVRNWCCITSELWLNACGHKSMLLCFSTFVLNSHEFMNSWIHEFMTDYEATPHILIARDLRNLPKGMSILDDELWVTDWKSQNDNKILTQFMNSWIHGWLCCNTIYFNNRSKELTKRNVFKLLKKPWNEILVCLVFSIIYEKLVHNKPFYTFLES